MEEGSPNFAGFIGAPLHLSSARMVFSYVESQSKVLTDKVRDHPEQPSKRYLMSRAPVTPPPRSPLSPLQHPYLGPALECLGRHTGLGEAGTFNCEK
ncbi:hypothetical protein J6590_002651 [Homalodisca vitripennis]|nr:hypothetical protein J6590_002651 [Homalodisca vitripennis]